MSRGRINYNKHKETGKKIQNTLKHQNDYMIILEKPQVIMENIQMILEKRKKIR